MLLALRSVWSNDSDVMSVSHFEWMWMCWSECFILRYGWDNLQRFLPTSAPLLFGVWDFMYEVTLLLFPLSPLLNPFWCLFMLLHSIKVISRHLGRAEFGLSTLRASQLNENFIGRFQTPQVSVVFSRHCMLSFSIHKADSITVSHLGKGFFLLANILILTCRIESQLLCTKSETENDRPWKNEQDLVPVKCSTVLSSGESRNDAEKWSPLRHSFTMGFVAHLYSLSGFPPPSLNHSGLCVLLWKKHAFVNKYFWCVKECNNRSFWLLQYQIVLICSWSFFFFLNNMCWKCSNIPHHCKNSDLKQQPHPFCLWHFLLLNHLLSLKLWWESCALQCWLSRWHLALPSHRNTQSSICARPRVPESLSIAGWAESWGTPGAVKGSGAG